VARSPPTFRSKAGEMKNEWSFRSDHYMSCLNGTEVGTVAVLPLFSSTAPLSALAKKNKLLVKGSEFWLHMLQQWKFL